MKKKDTICDITNKISSLYIGTGFSYHNIKDKAYATLTGTIKLFDIKSLMQYDHNYRFNDQERLTGKLSGIMMDRSKDQSLYLVLKLKDENRESYDAFLYNNLKDSIVVPDIKEIYQHIRCGESEVPFTKQGGACFL